MHIIATDIDWTTIDRGRRDQEQCALLLGYRSGSTASVKWLAPIKNRAGDPTRDFRVLRSDVPDHLVKYYLGVAHTHTGASNSDPSISDVRSIPPNTIGAVVHLRTRTVTFYDSNGFLLKQRFGE